MDKNLSNLPYFSISQLSLYYSSRGVTLVNISRGLKSGKIVKIREGFYVYNDFLNEVKFSGNLHNYLEFIATNIVYSPSYLSLEYVLFENNIITENTYNLTLITTKKTARFENTFGSFNYKSIKKDFFGDYDIIKKGDFIIYKATKEKALFDYLYLKRDIIFSLDYISELRFNLENINFQKFEKLLKTYKSKKVEKIFILLKQLKGL